MEIRSPYIAIVAATSLSVIVASTAFTTIFAVALSLDRLPIRVVAIAAAASNAVAFCFLCTFSVQLWMWNRRRTRTSWRQLAIVAANVVVAILATSLTAILLAQMRGTSRQASDALGRNADGLVTAAFVLWALSILAHIVMFSIYGLTRRTTPGHNRMKSKSPSEPVSTETMTVRPSTATSVQTKDKDGDRDLSPPLDLSILTPSHSADDSTPSPPSTARSSETRSRFRTSLHQAVHPANSRTRLLGRTSLPRDSRSLHSDQRSIAGSSMSDGFDAWDTSEVDSHAREAVLQSGPTQRTALETIPGSRPASPAKALDGPFPSQDTEPELTAPVKTTQSCPTSPRLDESHIHPLFRSDSPTPPPSATPGTIVTASPFGGQILPTTVPPFTRTRSNSRPKSPSPLKNSRSFDGSQPMRHPSLPRRKTNPPIPDFVLSAGSETSWIGVGKRKDSASLELPR